MCANLNLVPADLNRHGIIADISQIIVIYGIPYTILTCEIHNKIALIGGVPVYVDR